MFLFMVTILLFVMIIVGTYIFSYTFGPWEEIGDSTNRMVMFLIPIILFLTPLLFSTKKFEI